MVNMNLQLFPTPLPPRGSRAANQYAAIAQEFVDGGYESARVGGDAKPATVAAGLKKTILELSLPVKVVSRNDEVYLVRHEGSQDSML